MPWRRVTSPPGRPKLNRDLVVLILILGPSFRSAALIDRSLFQHTKSVASAIAVAYSPCMQCNDRSSSRLQPIEQAASWGVVSVHAATDLQYPPGSSRGTSCVVGRQGLGRQVTDRVWQHDLYDSSRLLRTYACLVGVTKISRCQK